MVLVSRDAPILGNTKEIREANIALTSACSLRCGYCFINKDSGEELSREYARQAVSFILSGRGRRRGIHLYGGEPLLRFERVREIVSFARSEAKRLGKELFPGVCSNGTLLRDEHVEYFKQEKVHLSISLNGTRLSHDRFRKFRGGAGSFDLIVRRLPRAFRVLGAEGMTALMCVHPESAHRAFEDFKSLSEIGFDVVNVEVIHGFTWSSKQKDAFLAEMGKIEDFVFSEASRGRFLFVESCLRYLRGEDAVFETCPLHSSLCVFPDGSYSLYPHPFLGGDSEAAGGAAIGHAAEGLRGRFRDCSFDAESRECRTCAQRYYVPGPLTDGSDVFVERCRVFKRMARRILDRAGKEPAMRAYAKEGLRRVMRYHA